MDLDGIDLRALLMLAEHGNAEDGPDSKRKSGDGWRDGAGILWFGLAFGTFLHTA